MLDLNTASPDQSQHFRASRANLLGELDDQIVARISRRCQISPAYAHVVAEMISVSGEG